MLTLNNYIFEKLRLNKDINNQKKSSSLQQGDHVHIICLKPEKNDFRIYVLASAAYVSSISFKEIFIKDTLYEWCDWKFNKEQLIRNPNNIIECTQQYSDHSVKAVFLIFDDFTIFKNCISDILLPIANKKTLSKETIFKYFDITEDEYIIDNLDKLNTVDSKTYLNNILKKI